jgi:hypothetical protein
LAILLLCCRAKRGGKGLAITREKETVPKGIDDPAGGKEKKT